MAGMRVQAAVVAAAGLLAVLPTPARWVEALYSRGLYPAARNVIAPLTSRVPIALFDLLLAGAVVGLCVWWAVVLRRTIAAGPTVRGGRRRIALAAGLRAVTLLAGLYLVFLLAWGLNYRREPLAARLGHDPGRVTPQALRALANEAAGRLDALHAAAHRDAWPALDEMPTRLGGAFERVQRRLGASRLAAAAVPKPTLLTPYFRRAGIDGMISPFSLEVLINHTVLPFERPYVVAHEWAHLAGFAAESEASFVGWLTCLAGDDASRYSAWLFLLPRVTRHLGEAEQRRAHAELAPGPAGDLRAVAERLRDVAPAVRRNAHRVYDRYLKANRVDAGVASYGEVVDLILGASGWRELAAPAPDRRR